MKTYAAMIGMVAVVALSGCNQMQGRHDNDNQRNYSGMHDGERCMKDREHMMHTDWQGHHAQAMADYFLSQADTHHRGYLTQRDVEAFSRRMFREADANHNGKVTRDELAAQKTKEMSNMRDWMRSHMMKGRMEDNDDRSDSGSDINDDNNGAMDNAR